jgi:predicted GH43/DUF377 family glycosyl hydrolase
MKKVFILSSLFLVLIIIGCSSDPVGLDTTKDSGKILLKVDKQNAPESVVFVKAYLTRENHQPITGTLNLQSDSTADILLDNIDAGEWHLKVDAEDDSGLVLYTGETAVQIFAGFTSQVYLTLNPTGSGTGSVYISVNWGVPSNHSWIDYLLNPVLTKLNNFYDQNGISHPVILYDNGIFKMWFNTMAGDGRSYTFYATSPDGKIWTRYNNNPVLQPGSANEWDNGGTTATCVVKIDNIYKLYYTGYSSYTNRYNIGLATSLDGINWTKNVNPVLTGTTNSWDYQISSGDVVHVQNVYYLFYHTSSYGYGEYKICVATSADGVNFSKYSNNPIIVQTQPWEESGIARPSVIYDESKFKMVYMNTSGSDMSLGMATSTDGFNWTKTESNPIFGCPMTSNAWASAYVAYPCFRKIGNEYRIYYSGSNIFNQQYGKIGFVSKFQ